MRAIEKPLGTVARAAGIVGGIALMVLMLTTVVDVFLRATFNVAFLGVTEITELGLIVVAVLGIAYCAWTEGHIALEFGESLLSERTWRALQIVERLTSTAIAGAVAFYSFVEAAAVYNRNAHTNLLIIPEYPFYLVVGFGFLTYALILLHRAFAKRNTETAEPRP